MRALIVVALVAPVAGFGYFPADHTVYEGYFCSIARQCQDGCASDRTSGTLAGRMPRGAHPDSLVSADLWTTGAESARGARTIALVKRQPASPAAPGPIYRARPGLRPPWRVLMWAPRIACEVPAPYRSARPTNR